jgi:quercetin dioxygenase-like cupin family protein
VIQPTSKVVPESIEYLTTVPDVIVNPISGQTVTFLSDARESLRTRFDVAAGHESDPRHIHPMQLETINVIEGHIGCNRPDRVESVLGPGQRWEIEPGTPHTWTALDDHVVLHIDFRPGLRTRRFMTRLFELAADGKTNTKGVPSALQLSVLALEYQPEFLLASPAWFVQKPILTMLALLARPLGYRP